MWTVKLGAVACSIRYGKCYVNRREELAVIGFTFFDRSKGGEMEGGGRIGGIEDIRGVEGMRGDGGDGGEGGDGGDEGDGEMGGMDEGKVGMEGK